MFRHNFRTPILAMMAMAVTPIYSAHAKTVTEEVIYKKANGVELNLTVVKPADTGKNPRPCLVWFHGGSFDHGSPNYHLKHAQYFAEQGYVNLLVKYRLIVKPKKGAQPTPGAAVPAGRAMDIRECVMDAKSAIRYIRSHAKDLAIDPEKIVTIGASAGGHLALSTALLKEFDDPNDDLAVSCKPNAVVVIEGVIDNGPDGWGNNLVAPYWKSISPAHQISETKNPPPILIVDLKKAFETKRSTAKLAFPQNAEKAGGICEMYLIESQGPHMASVQGDQLKPTLERIGTFLAKHFGG